VVVSVFIRSQVARALLGSRYDYLGGALRGDALMPEALALAARLLTVVDPLRNQTVAAPPTYR